MNRGYSAVTELPGSGATAEQLEMLSARYTLAGTMCAGRDVIEVACGPGIGLGYLGRRARRIVGGDYDAALLQIARTTYDSRLPLLRLDAHALPFASGSADVIILFEAVYYLREPEQFVREARRVLRPGGRLLISTVNRDWSGFNPSPFSHRYLSGPELYDLLVGTGFAARLYGGFPPRAATARDRLLKMVRRIAVTFHLIPGTMRAKERLKRLIYGRLTPLPAELSDPVEQFEPLPIPARERTSRFKVLYAFGVLPPGTS